MQLKPLLITGQNGEVGCALSRVLSEIGQPVISLDQYINTAGNGSLTPKRLLHVAGRADENKPEAMLDGNIDYLRKTMAYADEIGIDEIIYISSAAVYGKQNKENVSENDPLISPGLYGASKLLAEYILQTVSAKTICLRLPAVLELYKTSNFMSRTFEKLRAGKTVSIYNGDRIFNNFIGPSTLAIFIKNLCMEKKHDIVNLASRKQLTLFEVTMQIKEHIGSTSNILPLTQDREFFNLSIDKAIQNYSYQPEDARTALANWCALRKSLQEKIDV